MPINKTIHIRITAWDTTELLELLDKVAEDITEKEIEKIQDYNVSPEDYSKEEFCFPECEENKRQCACFQESLGCDEFHRKKEDALIFDNHKKKET